MPSPPLDTILLPRKHLPFLPHPHSLPRPKLLPVSDCSSPCVQWALIDRPCVPQELCSCLGPKVQSCVLKYLLSNYFVHRALFFILETPTLDFRLKTPELLGKAHQIDPYNALGCQGRCVGRAEASGRARRTRHVFNWERS